MVTKTDKMDKADAAADEDAPLSIEAKVVDNAYIELRLDGRLYTLREDEAHRLRKVMDRAAIELPR